MKGERQPRERDPPGPSGWPVFPCKPGSKEPATAHGVNDATTESGRIERFWRRRPDMNVAVATGGEGPDVLDVDVAHGKPGYDALRDATSAGLVPQPMGIGRDAQRRNSTFFIAATGSGTAACPSRAGLPRAWWLCRTAPSEVNDRPYVVVSAWHAEPAAIDFDRIRDHFAPQR